jgi:hypothetical protein
MAEPVIISWNPANWVTVVLMVTLGYVIVAAVYKVIKSNQGTMAKAA